MAPALHLSLLKSEQFLFFEGLVLLTPVARTASKFMKTFPAPVSRADAKPAQMSRAAAKPAPVSRADEKPAQVSRAF